MENKQINNPVKGLIASVMGILGALGGSANSNKAFRRYLIPCLFIAYFYYQTESILTLTIFLMVFPLSIGYGIPSPDDDKPSKIGNFFFDLFKGNILLTNFCSRGLFGLLMGISLFSIPLIKQNWNNYFILAGVNTLSFGLLAWRDFGVLKIKKWDLLWVDMVIYGIFGLLTFILL